VLDHDEDKLRQTIAAESATKRSGVLPDVVPLA
jgi:hypothetical protein